jgi:hypothetical protein
MLGPKDVLLDERCAVSGFAAGAVREPASIDGRLGA